MNFSAAWRALRATPAHSTDDATLTAQSDAARERLRADEAAQQTAALRRELDAERAQRAQAVTAALDARLDPILADAASVLGQLALQASLIEQGQPVGPRDVMALANSLARSFEKLGLTLIAQPGETAPFNPDHHQPLTGTAPPIGTPITIKIPGARIPARILRKSLITLN